MEDVVLAAILLVGDRKLLSAHQDFAFKKVTAHPSVLPCEVQVLSLSEWSGCSLGQLSRGQLFPQGLEGSPLLPLPIAERVIF